MSGTTLRRKLLSGPITIRLPGNPILTDRYGKQNEWGGNFGNENKTNTAKVGQGKKGYPGERQEG